jgi:hypothetical protein
MDVTGISAEGCPDLPSSVGNNWIKDRFLDFIMHDPLVYAVKRPNLNPFR